MARTGGRAALWAWLLLTAGSLAQVLSVIRIPSAHCALLVVAGAVGSTAPLMIEVAMIAGPAAAIAELRLDGSWLGLRSLGARGRDLGVPVLLWAGVLCVAALVTSHGVEPLARGWLRDARVEAAVGLRLDAGGSAAIGPWALSGQPDGGLRFAADADGQQIVGSADAVAIEAARGAVKVRLGAGEARGVPPGQPGGMARSDSKSEPPRASDAHTAEPGWQVRFQSLTTVLALSGGPRVETVERSTAELLRRALNPYERWILWKRTLLPAVLLPLALLGLPLGARLRAGVGVGALALAFWTLLRLSDTLARTGPGLASAALLVPCLLGLGIGWILWKDR